MNTKTLRANLLAVTTAIALGAALAPIAAHPYDAHSPASLTVSPTAHGKSAMHCPPVPSPPKRLMRTPSPSWSNSTRSSGFTAFGSSPFVGSHTEKITTFFPSRTSWMPK